MTEILSAIFLIVGGAFIIIAGLGIIRMPDLPMRMHATTKAGALGAGLILAAVAFYYDDLGVTARAIAGVAFVILTAPVAAHVIGRAGYFVGVPLWDKTIKDDLAGRYDTSSHRLGNALEDETGRPRDDKGPPA